MFAALLSRQRALRGELAFRPSAVALGTDSCHQTQYSDSQLYNQLLFFDTLFDVEKAKSRVSGTGGQGELSALSLYLLSTDLSLRSDTVMVLADANKATLAHLRAVVTKHLDKNGRRWVSMSSLFSFIK